MIVVFTGWRDWTDATFIRTEIDKVIGNHMMFGTRTVPVTVRVGEQRGADAIVRNHVAGIDGVQLAVYDAGWTAENHNYAGSVRNKRMLFGQDAFDPTGGKRADLVVAFPQPGKVWTGKGSGTWNCITQAQVRGFRVEIPAYYDPDPPESGPEALFAMAHTGGES